MTGGGGSDEYSFSQGDSPVITAKNLGGDGVLNNGDTFSFANGIDRITDFSSGEGFSIDKPMGDFVSGVADPGLMATTPSNGMATDQGIFAVQGNYAGSTFTVDNTGTGHDTLVVYDGDVSAAVTQTAIVLSGVTLAQLELFTGSNWISHV
jgi:hypothetical protein